MGSFNAAMDALSSHEIHTTVVLCKRVSGYINQIIASLLKLGQEVPANMKDLLLTRIKQLKELLRDLEAQINDSRNLARLAGHF